jgi:hypothetical protein
MAKTAGAGSGPTLTADFPSGIEAARSRAVAHWGQSRSQAVNSVAGPVTKVPKQGNGLVRLYLKPPDDSRGWHSSPSDAKWECPVKKKHAPLSMILPMRPACRAVRADHDQQQRQPPFRWEIYQRNKSHRKKDQQRICTSKGERTNNRTRPFCSIASRPM